LRVTAIQGKKGAGTNGTLLPPKKTMESVVDTIKTAWISFSCPMCGIENRCRVVDVALQERVHCRGCHETIQLVDKDASTVKAFRGAANAINDLGNALREIK
jgi:hypothetical protein